MRHSRILLMMAIGTLVFAIGMFVTDARLRVPMLIAGAVLVFIFYLYTFIEVIRTRRLDAKRRTFWLTAIICLPVIGNLIYVLFQDLGAAKQVPKLQNY